MTQHQHYRHQATQPLAHNTQNNYKLPYAKHTSPESTRILHAQQFLVKSK